MDVVAASAEQLAAMRRDASEFQAYALGPVSTAVLRRYAFWRELVSPRSVGANSQTITDALQAAGIVSVIHENDQADDAAVKFAQAVKLLNAGALELAHHTDERGQVLQLGVVRAGSIPTTLQLWPIVPVIVVGAALYGAFVLFDAWLSMRTLEAQSDQLRAKTQAAVSDAVTRAGAQSPQAASMLADALERANNAAAGVQPGLLDRLAGAVSDVGSGIRDSSGLLLLVGAAWLWSRRKRAA